MGNYVCVGEKVKIWVDPQSIETHAFAQIQNMAELSIVSGIAVMPDCHHGKGATVGSVIATLGAVIPAAVGVDIGCGMNAVKTKFFAKDLPDNLERLRDNIERRVPVSAGGYNQEIEKSAGQKLRILEETMQDFYDKIDRNWRIQLGTLGSGNHFIELCLDENDRVWVVLHSGSRGIGNKLAMIHIKTAQKLTKAAGVSLKDWDLAYLTAGTKEFSNYIRDLLWAQDFARLNREEMMDRVMEQVSVMFFGKKGHEEEIEIDRINCHHNFTQEEVHFGKTVWLTRKGAIEMKQGQRGIIPGSMGTSTYIVSGLGNPLSYNSAPHGAGRRLSRTKAREQLSFVELQEMMKGIVWRNSTKLLDESPEAYKDINEIIAQSSDLVCVDHVLRQVLNVKGD